MRGEQGRDLAVADVSSKHVSESSSVHPDSSIRTTELCCLSGIIAASEILPETSRRECHLNLLIVLKNVLMPFLCLVIAARQGPPQGPDQAVADAGARNAAATLHLEPRHQFGKQIVSLEKELER